MYSKSKKWFSDMCYSIYYISNFSFDFSKLRGAKVWVHIQDFEFDAAVESGLAGNQEGIKAKVFKYLFKIENF